MGLEVSLTQQSHTLSGRSMLPANRKASQRVYMPCLEKNFSKMPQSATKKGQRK